MLVQKKLFVTSVWQAVWQPAEINSSHMTWWSEHWDECRWTELKECCFSGRYLSKIERTNLYIMCRKSLKFEVCPEGFFLTRLSLQHVSVNFGNPCLLKAGKRKLLDRNYLWKLCQKQRKHGGRSFLLSMYVFEWRDVKYLKAFPWACRCNHQEISTTNVPFYHCLLILSSFNSLKPTFLFLPAFVTLCKFISYTSKPSTCQSKDLPGLSFPRTDATR